MNQQSSKQSKNIIQSITDQIKNHKNTIAFGIGMTALLFGLKFFSSRLHPDIRKVLKLKQIIQLSQPLSLKALQNLKVEKTIQTTYGKSQQNISHNNEINMQFLLITKLKLKQTNKQQQLRNPFLPPFQQGIFISQLQPSHRLVYNKFNIYQNHLIVITKQFQSQNNELNEQDFKQTILIVKALDGLLFFNCGKDSGSSQPHKHIQVFPKESLQLPIIKQIALFVQNIKQNHKNIKDKIFQFPGFNFIHGIIILEPKVSITESKRSMYKAYQLILEQTVKKINLNAYNVIGTQSFIMVIPRRKQKAFDQIAINSVGFMGSILFKDQEKLNKYLSLKIKPSSILEDITYPKDYQPQQEIQQQMIKQKPQLKQ